jgi:ATP-dependent Clp protease adaptor protein ClpS
MRMERGREGRKLRGRGADRMAVQGETREKTRIDIREPKKYRVIMHNDDFTSMEFVVEILVNIFRKEQAEAERLMLTVHESGRAAVGTYPYDIAVTRVQTAAARAKEEGFPFRMTIEEA